MRVLVTGAAGLIGSATVDALVRAGHQVRAADRRTAPAGDTGDGARWMTGDLGSAEVARRAVAGMDAVAHLAAIPSPTPDCPEAVYLNNTAATFQVLTAAAETGVSRVVLASSISVLGLVWSPVELAPPSVPVSEECPLQVADPYALAKQADEAAAAMAHRRWGTTVLAYRFPDVAGTARLQERGALVRRDPAEAHRELWAYLHVADAAYAIRLGLESNITGCHVLNVVAGDSLGGVDVAAQVRRFYPGTTVTSPIPAGTTAYTTTRAAELIGFRATRHWSGSPRLPESAAPALRARH